MDKSQLRRLALDFAQGHVDHESYVRERTELIDAIVAGDIQIEREKPQTVQPVAQITVEPEPPTTEARETVGPPPAPAKRLSPMHILIGGVVIALAVGFFLTGEDAQQTKPPEAPTVDNPPPPSPPEPAAKMLVDRFLLENDWSSPGLASFMNEWQSLSTEDRQEARSAPWFRRLSTALKQVINAQRALAGLPDGDSANVEGQRLVDFANSIGIAGPFPSFESSSDASDSAAQTEPSTQILAKDSPTHTATDETSNSQLAPVVATNETGAAEPPSTASEHAEHSSQAGFGGSWIEALPDDAWVIQLFAVNQLEAVDKQMAAHPTADLHVVPASDNVTPKYRVVNGPYPDQITAKAAYAGLPNTLKNGSVPLFRSVSALRTALHGNAATPTEVVSLASASSEKAAPGLSDAYTLQLFASDRRDNVEKMMAEYPGIGLRMFGGDKFRVLFGDFESTDAAKAAVSTLPEALLQATGTPLIKTSADPDGAAVSWGE
ncbi:MAG: hypothetical protein HOI95_24785 [Chromatiales bacterium]|jgi:septal ring-binding cell division protein DamX|nr:hypothetical protein [Chromatiales bacterium]